MISRIGNWIGLVVEALVIDPFSPSKMMTTTVPIHPPYSIKLILFIRKK
jgi:hypothetical protein